MGLGQSSPEAESFLLNKGLIFICISLQVLWKYSICILRAIISQSLLNILYAHVCLIRHKCDFPTPKSAT